MRFIPLSAAALVALLGAAPAHATVSIALQEAGVNGGAPTVVATAPDFASVGITYGTFKLNYVGVSDLTSLLDSTALNVSTAVPGDLLVYVTATDQSPLGATRFTSSLTANLAPPGWTEVLATWLDPANVAFGQVVPLSGAAFTTIGTDVESVDATVTAPFSVTGVYLISSAGLGTSLLTEHVEATALPVPEPTSLALLGAGLLGARVALRRRRSVA